MEAKRNFPVQYIAGGCFLILAVLDLVTFIDRLIFCHNLEIRYGTINCITMIVGIGGFMLIALGLFISARRISAIGCALNAIMSICWVIIAMLQSFGGENAVTLLLEATADIMLLIACLDERKSVIFGIISAAAYLLSTFITFFILYFVYYGYNSGTFLTALLFCAGAVLLGIAPRQAQKKPVRTAAAAPAADDYSSPATDTYSAPAADNESDPFTMLLKLEELLGKGYITQEEFDAKKKELLGL